ncbi:Ankyrin repeat and fibronectin type-III domain-containing protein 1, partial [Geodia barretti]
LPPFSPSLSKLKKTLFPRPPKPPPPPTGFLVDPNSLQRLLPTTVDTFLHNLGIFKEDAEKHQLYCQEVIELSEDISLILILPPSDQVCTPPGSTDHFAKLSDFVALPINTFEIMQLYTYQKSFMTKFSTVSARLDIELLTSQQRMREAFSKVEVTAAKQLKEQLESFQERTDAAWKEMRWIEDAVQKGRNQATVSSASSLLPVKVLRDVTRINLPGGLRGSPTPEPNSGYLRVFPAYTTGLVSGTSVRLFITESTTTTEVIHLVVQQLEKARIDKGIPGPPLTEEDVAGFYLVARLNGKETALDYDYTPLQLQSNPQHKWRLLVRRVAEERRTSSEQTTSV